MNFHIEEREGRKILVFTDGGCRPAHDTEIAMEKDITAMREAIREAHTSIKYAEASFAGMALRLHPADPSNDAVLERTGAALAKLQPYLK